MILEQVKEYTERTSERLNEILAFFGTDCYTTSIMVKYQALKIELSFESLTESYLEKRNEYLRIAESVCEVLFSGTMFYGSYSFGVDILMDNEKHFDEMLEMSNEDLKLYYELHK